MRLNWPKNRLRKLKAVHEDKKAALAEAKNTYDLAKLAYAEAVVDLADAQESYDQFLKTSSEQNEENTQKTEADQKKTENKTDQRETVKTGDPAEPAVYTAVGMGDWQQHLQRGRKNTVN